MIPMLLFYQSTLLESITIAQLYHYAGRVYAYKRSSVDVSGFRPVCGKQQLDPPSSPDLAIADASGDSGDHDWEMHQE